jgi:hypothetical protein
MHVPERHSESMPVSGSRYNHISLLSCVARCACIHSFLGHFGSFASLPAASHTTRLIATARMRKSQDVGREGIKSYFVISPLYALRLVGYDFGGSESHDRCRARNRDARNFFCHRLTS